MFWPHPPRFPYVFSWLLSGCAGSVLQFFGNLLWETVSFSSLIGLAHLWWVVWLHPSYWLYNQGQWEEILEQGLSFCAGGRSPYCLWARRKHLSFTGKQWSSVAGLEDSEESGHSRLIMRPSRCLPCHMEWWPWDWEFNFLLNSGKY